MAGWDGEASGSATLLLLSDSVFVRRPWRLLLKFVCSVPVVPGWKDRTSRLCWLGEEIWKQEHGAGAGAVSAALLPCPVEDAN